MFNNKRNFDEFNERANQSETEIHILRNESSRLQTKVSELESKCFKATEDLLEIKSQIHAGEFAIILDSRGVIRRK